MREKISFYFERNEGMNTDKKSIVYLHIATMLFGLSGVIRQFVEVPSVTVALGRVICSSPLLLGVIVAKKEKLCLDNRKDYFLIIAAGMVLAAHWTTFFQAIQVASVAIGTISFSTYPLFLTFLEPLLFHERIQKKGLIGAIILMIGVFITIPEFSLENRVTVGIIWGLLSAVTYAVLTLANRYFAKKYDEKLICFYEQGTTMIVLLPTLFLVRVQMKAQDIAGIILIGCVCTAVAYTLFVSAQKKVKAQTAGLISGLETVYGLVYAWILLGEIPTVREVVGGVVIISVAVFTSLQKE